MEVLTSTNPEVAGDRDDDGDVRVVPTSSPSDSSITVTITLLLETANVVDSEFKWATTASLKLLMA